MAVDMTLAEAMALAVLRGDEAAALALADRLIEGRLDTPGARERLASGPRRNPVSALEVFGWPEFRALALRLGIQHRLPTTSLTIDLDVGGSVRVTHRHLGSVAAAVDPGPPPG